MTDDLEPMSLKIQLNDVSPECGNCFSHKPNAQKKEIWLQILDGLFSCYFKQL